VSGAYYNEIDTYCAAWLRNLIDAGHIPSGDVDERSIVDVRSDDLRGYDQCHFFAGIGGWPYALRLAGWPDDAEVWTGSCPCQPFSCAGQRKGDADERHLWPAFFRLIAERRPATVFGEQVSGKDGLEWLSAVRADLEGIGYAVGAADLPACSVGAPHIRRRLFWVAHAKAPISSHRGSGAIQSELSACGGKPDGLADRSRPRLEEWQERAAIERSGETGGAVEHSTSEQVEISGRAWEQGSAVGGMAHAKRHAAEPWRAAKQPNSRTETERARTSTEFGRCGDSSVLAHSIGARLEERQEQPTRQERAAIERSGDAGELGYSGCERWRQVCENAERRGEGSGAQRLAERPLHERDGNPWSDLEWLPCIDGKWRPTKPGLQPLAHGVSFKLGSGGALEGKSRVGMLRASGNAIVPQVSAEFIMAAMEAMP